MKRKKKTKKVAKRKTTKKENIRSKVKANLKAKAKAKKKPKRGGNTRYSEEERIERILFAVDCLLTTDRPYRAATLFKEQYNVTRRTAVTFLAHAREAIDEYMKEQADGLAAYGILRAKEIVNGALERGRFLEAAKGLDTLRSFMGNQPQTPTQDFNNVEWNESLVNGHDK